MPQSFSNLPDFQIAHFDLEATKPMILVTNRACGARVNAGKVQQAFCFDGAISFFCNLKFLKVIIMAKSKGRSKMNDDEVIDQDEVIYEEETASKASASSAAPQSFMEKYRNMLLIGGVAVVAIGGYFIYNWSQKDKVNQEAQAAMITSALYYEQDSMAKAINGDGQNPSLIEIVDDFGSTDAGNLGRYYLGTAYFKTGNLEEGITTLEEYKKGNSMISAAAFGALGYAYEQKGEFEQAAKNYEEAAHTPEDNMYSTPFYLMHAGRNLESANKAEEALKVYQEIKEKYPMSDQSRDGSVDRNIAKLSPEDFE
jgi:tetratricopeptide (TPR) repeat protein